MPASAAAPAAPPQSANADDERGAAQSDAVAAATEAGPAPFAAPGAAHPQAAGPSRGPGGQSAAKSTGTRKDDAPRPEAAGHELFILYTGSLSLLVDDGRVAATIDHIIDAAIASGGHIGSRRDDSVSVVVPSNAFRSAFAGIEGLGEVLHRAVAAQDVSEEYHDAEVRLTNLKATRKRLEEFLAKAPSVGEMLTVERELERVAMDIDRTEGRMRFLREHTAFSTLTVELSARRKSAPLVRPAEPPPPPRAIDLPAKWLGELGFERLISGK